MSEATPAAEPDSVEPRGFSRRTIVTAAAWSVPAIVLATAAPAAAASNSTVTLGITPAAKVVGLGGTTTTPDFTVTALTIPGGTPDASSATVTVTLPAGFVFASGGVVGATTWAFPTNGSSHVFTVRSNGTGASTGVITVTSPETFADPVSATIQAVGFAGWGYNLSGEGQVRPGEGHQLSAYYMVDTFATTSITATGGTWRGLLWADQAGRLWERGWNGYFSSPVALSPRRAETAAGVPLEKSFTYIARGVEQFAGIAVASGDSVNPNNTVWAVGESSSGFSAAAYTANGYWQQVANAPAFLANIPAGDQITQVELMRDGQAVYLLQPSGQVLFSGADSGGSAGQGVGGTFLGAPMKTALNTPITGAVSIATGFFMSAVVTAAGAVYTTGTNTFWGGSGTSYLAQKPLPNERLAAKVVIGQTGLIVIARDGTAWALGENWFGGLGVGSSANPGAIYAQVALSDVVDVKYGNEGAHFLTGGGDVYFAGANDAGQAGSGVNGGIFYTPVKVPLSGPATAIGVNWHDSSYAFVA